LHRAGPVQRKLALGELEALAGALLPVLLALLHARIAREKTVLAQRRAQLEIEARNGARQSHAYGPGLTASAATVRGDDHIHLIGQVGELERFGGVVLPGVVRKVGIHLAAVDRKLASARTQKHARDGFLAPSRTVEPNRLAR